MKMAMISLSLPGAKIIRLLADGFAGADLYLSRDVKGSPGFKRFGRVVALTRRIFNAYDALVYVMPCGIVVRALSGLPRDKRADPAVVMVDAGGRYAVSLLSGHEGGANDLAVRISNAIGAEPVISTATEAAKTVIAGVGCRRGVSAERIVAAVRSAAKRAGVDMKDIRYIASADIKAKERGLVAAAERLNMPLRFIASDEIRNTRRAFTCSKVAKRRVNLPAVAEPAALLAGRRTELILPRTAFNGITVALARERCLSLE